jgi:hypothetical protein
VPDARGAAGFAPVESFDSVAPKSEPASGDFEFEFELVTRLFFNSEFVGAAADAESGARSP